MINDFRRISLLPLFFTAIVLVSCRTQPDVNITAVPPALPAAFPQLAGQGGGIVDEIRSNTERGTPQAIMHSLDVIRNHNLGGTEFGRVMNFVNTTLLNVIYPGVRVSLPRLDPPLLHIYARILREAEAGVYVTPRQNSVDYLEFVLPFLAIYPGRTRVQAAIGRQVVREVDTPVERYFLAMKDLQRAVELNAGGVIASYFIAVVYEQTGRIQEALGKYALVWERTNEFFPAKLAIARIMERQGNTGEAVRILSELADIFPENLQITRPLAIALYHNREWTLAEAAVDKVLESSPRDGEFVLMRTHILVEQGQFLRAQAPLDVHATINPNNAMHLFLRARVQAEGFNNNDAALNYLRTLLRMPPSINGELRENAAVYAARLLMASPRPADRAEGRELISGLLAVPSPPPEVVALALDDAMRREAWGSARTYLNRLLSESRSFDNLLAAYTLERSLGNSAAALAFARELHLLQPANDEGIIAYASALIDLNRNSEAQVMIEARLAAVPGGQLRSRYLFLRSRIQPSEALMLADLRASLFEHPRNLDSLIATFEVHHRHGDRRRAAHYLRQALAIAPEDSRLLRHTAEYQTMLGGGF